MVVFNLPFQSSDMGLDVATPSDIALAKCIWGEREPLGLGGCFAVAASLPAGVEKSDETTLLIQRRVNAVMIHAGVSDKRVASIGVVYVERTQPGLEITPQIVMDCEGNPLGAGGY